MDEIDVGIREPCRRKNREKIVLDYKITKLVPGLGKYKDTRIRQTWFKFWLLFMGDLSQVI